MAELDLPASGPFRSVGFTLSSLGYAVARGFTQTLAPLDIEPRDFALLRALAASEGDSQQAIGERLGIPASRMVGFIDAHEARGLIERRPDPGDRRIHALHLTDAGRELLAPGVGQMQRVDAPVPGVWAALDQPARFVRVDEADHAARGNPQPLADRLLGVALRSGEGAQQREVARFDVQRRERLREATGDRVAEAREREADRAKRSACRQVEFGHCFLIITTNKHLSYKSFVIKTVFA